MPSRYHKGFIFPHKFSWRCWFGWHNYDNGICTRCSSKKVS